MARSMGRLVEELLEQSEASALNRQVPPGRRRPAALAQALRQNEQYSQRAVALTAEPLEAQTSTAGGGALATAQAPAQNEQQTKRVDGLPVGRVETPAAPAGLTPVAAPQALPQNEQQPQRAATLPGEPFEARMAIIARDLSRLIEAGLARSDSRALSRQNAPARRRPAA